MKYRGGLFVFAALAAFIFNSSTWAADVEPWFVEGMNSEEVILEPGTTAYCDKNFQVENMSEDTAEVHVILGNGANYASDMLDAKSSKSYALTSDYPLAGGWEETKGIHIDEARIVNSTGGTSKIKVTCK